jgi:hypothetical protein
VSRTIGKIAMPIVESDRCPSLVTEESLKPKVFDDAIDPEGSELENRVDKLDMEIDQHEDFDEDSCYEPTLYKNVLNKNKQITDTSRGQASCSFLLEFSDVLFTVLA